MFVNSLHIVSLWFTMCVAALSQHSHPVPPSRDPWYKAPADWESKPPGTILRSRKAPGNLSAIIGNASEAYNLLYRTTDSRFQPSWAVTTILVPSSPTISKNDTLGNIVSYQIAYDSADVDASPSYAMYTADEDSRLTNFPSDNIYISELLSKGWYVNVPDYEGPLGSFGAGVMSGHATLDSVRAILSAQLAIGDGSFQYALWGYSGGGLASGWAAELCVQYAPELNFSGVVLGGAATNFSSIFNAVDGTAAAGLLPAALVGLTSQFPDARNELIEHLNTDGPFNATSFLTTENLTFAEELAVFAGHKIEDYFVDGQFPLTLPRVAKAAYSNTYLGYNGVPPMPVFGYKAIEDRLAMVEVTDLLFERYCEVGANVLYERNTVGGHVAEIINGAPRSVNWLASIFEGTYNLTSGCLFRNVTVNITSAPDTF